MTVAQIEDLFIEWDLYEEKAKREMLEEFRRTAEGSHSMDDFLEFLRVRLNIDRY